MNCIILLLILSLRIQIWAHGLSMKIEGTIDLESNVESLINSPKVKLALRETQEESLLESDPSTTDGILNNLTNSIEAINRALKASSSLEFGDHNLLLSSSSENNRILDSDVDNKVNDKDVLMTRAVPKITIVNEDSRDHTDNHSEEEGYDSTKVKDNEQVNNFIGYIQRNSFKVLDSLKNEIDNPEIVHKMTTEFRKKFDKFLSETENLRMKTTSGKRRVILHIMDMANRLLIRLTSHLPDDTAARTKGTVKIYRDELNKYKEIENKHLCKRYHICIQTKPYSEFVTEFLYELFINDDKKLKHALDAVTETLKKADFNKVFTSKAKKVFKKTIIRAEKHKKPVRPMFALIVNFLRFKNLPITVTNVTNADIVEKTVAYNEIINIFDETIENDEENLRVWSKAKSDLEKWSAGKKRSIQGVVQRLVDNFIQKGINKLSKDKLKKIKEKLDFICGPRHVHSS